MLDLSPRIVLINHSASTDRRNHLDDEVEPGPIEGCSNHGIVGQHHGSNKSGSGGEQTVHDGIDNSGSSDDRAGAMEAGRHGCGGIIGWPTPSGAAGRRRWARSATTRGADWMKFRELVYVGDRVRLMTAGGGSRLRFDAGPR